MIPFNLSEADNRRFALYTAIDNLSQKSGEHIVELSAEIIYCTLSNDSYCNIGWAVCD